MVQVPRHIEGCRSIKIVRRVVIDIIHLIEQCELQNKLTMNENNVPVLQDSRGQNLPQGTFFDTSPPAVF